MPQTTTSDSLSHRRLMVDGQIRTFGITNADLIDRFLAVPREKFVGADHATLAWSDAPLRIGGNSPRELLRPLVLAKMLQGVAIKPTDKVLDIAGGLGYCAALVAGMASRVVTVETDPNRTAAVAQCCAMLGIANVTALTGDLVTAGRDLAPFDVIIINGAVETGLADLFALLADGGRLVAVRNKPGDMVGEAICYEKHGVAIGERILFETKAEVLPGFVALPVFAL